MSAPEQAPRASLPVPAPSCAPSFDSPVEPSSGTPVEPSWRIEYRERGYAVIRDVLPVARLDRVAAEMHEVYTQQLRRLGLPVTTWRGQASLLAAMASLLEADVEVYLAATRHAARLASLQQLVVGDVVLDIARTLGMSAVTVPTAPVLHVMGECLKVPGGYHGVATHQDWPVVQGALDAVTMWFSLFEVTPTTYPLAVIPSSHRRGRWPSRITEHTSEIDPAAYTEADFVPVPVARGDLLVFTGFTVHRTAVEGCAGLRIAASMRYENSAEPTFVRRLWPCAYQRSVRREVLFPDFPSQDEVIRALDT
ncbi:MAG: phytanoyl-CoA dioxygenase family protein [Proteobacteria bacterium]|nr:phytanoyl-CoA dioxygenase family protein [Burkholderiales bacterium]